ncbi:uncharacterized protein DEA37_0013270 [Paragonimus westermani]|uniref:RIIa domain-containing protein n=1 Tax=Paragonimus westermani TaxID=34504 RepID=A0A5J4P085_9TREM|nr:uncharacterized protein DEA37_0013270 [Paragonimus westermani]
MAVPFSNTTLRVPHGFPSLLEGLSREVLRYQPKDIYGFSEKYFAELLKKREGKWLFLLFLLLILVQKLALKMSHN